MKEKVSRIMACLENLSVVNQTTFNGWKLHCILQPLLKENLHGIPMSVVSLLSLSGFVYLFS